MCCSCLSWLKQMFDSLFGIKALKQWHKTLDCIGIKSCFCLFGNLQKASLSVITLNSFAIFLHGKPFQKLFLNKLYWRTIFKWLGVKIVEFVIVLCSQRQNWRNKVTVFRFMWCILSRTALSNVEFLYTWKLGLQKFTNLTQTCKSIFNVVSECAKHISAYVKEYR